MSWKLICACMDVCGHFNMFSKVIMHPHDLRAGNERLVLFSTAPRAPPPWRAPRYTVLPDECESGGNSASRGWYSDYGESHSGGNRASFFGADDGGSSDQLAAATAEYFQSSKRQRKDLARYDLQPSSQGEHSSAPDLLQWRSERHAHGSSALSGRARCSDFACRNSVFPRELASVSLRLCAVAFFILFSLLSQAFFSQAYFSLVYIHTCSHTLRLLTLTRTRILSKFPPSHHAVGSWLLLTTMGFDCCE